MRRRLTGRADGQAAFETGEHEAGRGRAVEVAAGGGGAFLDGAEGAEVDGVGGYEEGREGGISLLFCFFGVGFNGVWGGLQGGLEFGEEEDAAAFARVAETAERDVIFVGEGGALGGEAGAAVEVAAGGTVGVVGRCEAHRTLGDGRTAPIDPKPREAVLEELPSQGHCVRRFGAHFEADVDRDDFHGDGSLREEFQMDVEFLLDAGGEVRILDLNVRGDGACVWVCYDVYAGDAHWLCEQAEH